MFPSPPVAPRPRGGDLPVPLDQPICRKQLSAGIGRVRMQGQSAQVSVHGIGRANVTGPTIFNAKISTSNRGPAVMNGRLPKKDPITIFKETVSDFFSPFKGIQSVLFIFSACLLVPACDLVDGKFRELQLLCNAFH